MSIFGRLFGKKKQEQPALSRREEATQPTPATPVEATTAPAVDSDTAVTPTPVAGADIAPTTEKTTVRKTTEKQEKAAPPSAQEAPTTDPAPVKKASSTKKERSTAAKESAPEAEAPADDETVPDADTTQPVTGRFEIKRSRDGRYVFNLFAVNKVGIATSQVYSSASSALIGIKSVIHNAATAPIEDQTVKDYTVLPYPKWEIYRDKGNEFRFRLSASNGSCVCHSQGYTSKVNCKKGIDSIIRSSRNAVIDKAYLKKNEKSEE